MLSPEIAAQISDLREQLHTHADPEVVGRAIVYGALRAWSGFLAERLPVTIESLEKLSDTVDSATFASLAQGLRAGRLTLEELFEQVVDPQSRRALGQFNTPPRVADFMVRWAAAAGDRLIDPASGTGVFIEAIARQTGGKVRVLRAFDLDPLMV